MAGTAALYPAAATWDANARRAPPSPFTFNRYATRYPQGVTVIARLTRAFLFPGLRIGTLTDHRGLTASGLQV